MTFEIFSDFVTKVEIWNQLEAQYDFKQDYAQSQRNLEEIYESLHKYFTNGKDEKQETVN